MISSKVISLFFCTKFSFFSLFTSWIIWQLLVPFVVQSRSFLQRFLQTWHFNSLCFQNPDQLLPSGFFIFLHLLLNGVTYASCNLMPDPFPACEKYCQSPCSDKRTLLHLHWQLSIPLLLNSERFWHSSSWNDSKIFFFYTVWINHLWTLKAQAMMNEHLKRSQQAVHTNTRKAK